MVKIQESASSQEVLRHISESKLIDKIFKSGLIDESLYPEEVERTLEQNFDVYSEEMMDTRGFSSFSDFAKAILPNAPQEVRNELKYIKLEVVFDEVEDEASGYLSFEQMIDVIIYGY